MRQRFTHIALVAMVLVVTAGHLTGQRINFAIHAPDGLNITPGSVDELNFNDKQPLILGGSTVQILLTDNEAAVLAIEANAEYDITVAIDADPYLELEVGATIYQIPLTLYYAYSNTGAATEALAKQQSVPVPAGFSGITFPVLRRLSGAPAPPPTPDHTGYTAPKATAYLFLYGSIAVPPNIPAGSYTGTINIHVTYTTNLP